MTAETGTPTKIPEKNPGKTSSILRGFALGLLIGASISVVPICGIRRSSELVLSEPAQAILFVEWTIVSAITGSALLPIATIGDPRLKTYAETKNKALRLIKQLSAPVSTILFFLLYFAACGLCQRMNMGVINTDSALLQPMRYIGLVIATFALVMQTMSVLPSLKANADASPSTKAGLFQLRHPCFFATLVTLTGVPLVFGTWYPLFALPGIFVVIKWIIFEQERLLLTKFGEPYEQLQSKSRKVLPSLY